MADLSRLVSGSSMSTVVIEVERGEGINFGCAFFCAEASAESCVGEANGWEKLDVCLEFGMG